MFRNLRGFFTLPSQQRTHLMRALLIVGGVRAGLSLFSFPRLQTLLERFTARANAQHISTRPSRGQLAWAVRTASAYVPHATCLTQALAARVLFARYGYPAIVRIGVAPAEAGGTAFHAHAWLESDGDVVIGASTVPYTPLIAFGSDPA